MNKNSILCYVDGGAAYFTTQELSKQWGDDWNDAPYEHNAGDPYTFDEHDAKLGKDPWKITKIFFCNIDLSTPADHASSGNSHYSVEMINAGIVPWLSFSTWSNHKVVIKAGTTITDFIEMIEKAGGTVYLPKEKDSEA